MGALAGEERGRPVAVDDGQHGSLTTPAAGRIRTRRPGERGDLNPARGAERQGRLDGTAGVVGVHVHRVATAAVGGGGRDRDRVAELVEALAQVLDPVGFAAAQQVHHLETRRSGRRDSDLGVGGRRHILLTGRRVPGHDLAQRVEQHQQAATTGVDHARIGEHVKLLDGLVERDHCRVRSGDHHPGEIGTIGAGILGRFCGGPQHRHDGARHRFAHRCDDQTDRVAQRGGEDDAVDIGQFAAPLGGGFRSDVGQSAQDLGQDHPGVAPGAVQRAVGQGRCHPRHVVTAGRGVRLSPGRTHGEQHVRSGVGVRDRENVQPVDLVGVGDQVTNRGVGPIPQG